MSQLPLAFCWTKFGAEAGEAAGSILQRKEAERVANGGTFLWGIGTSIRPSVADLLQATSSPEVIFTPMKAAPAAHDVAPARIVRWQTAIGVDGQEFRIPEGSRVTSGWRNGVRKVRHYALVCESARPLGRETDTWIHRDSVRNLRTGMPVGSSQVTSVVRSCSAAVSGESNGIYRVAFRAALVYPYLLLLADPVEEVNDPGHEARHFAAV